MLPVKELNVPYTIDRFLDMAHANCDDVQFDHNMHDKGCQNSMTLMSRGTALMTEIQNVAF